MAALTEYWLAVSTWAPLPNSLPPSRRSAGRSAGRPAVSSNISPLRTHQAAPSFNFNLKVGQERASSPF